MRTRSGSCKWLLGRLMIHQLVSVGSQGQLSSRRTYRLDTGCHRQPVYRDMDGIPRNSIYDLTKCQENGMSENMCYLPFIIISQSFVTWSIHVTP